MPFTWTELLDSIKVRGQIPTGQNTGSPFTEDRIRDRANEVLRTKVLPDLLKVREEFYSYDIDLPIVSTGVYDIHNRAIGGKLDNVALISGTERLDLVLYDEDEIFDTDQAPSYRPGFYLKRNQIVTLPKDGSGYSYLRQTIFLRPAEIVSQDDGAQITAINTSTKVVTFTTVPSTWTTAMLYEMVQQKAHFDSLGIDLVITAITTGAGGTLTFSAALPDRLAVGDWVSLSGESPIVQLPVEWNPLLAQETACECLKNSPHAKAYDIAVKDAERLKKDLIPLVAPRVEKEGKKLVNSSGILRRGR